MASPATRARATSPSPSSTSPSRAGTTRAPPSSCRAWTSTGSCGSPGNTFYDNADGVVLYQNADRCCGSSDGCTANCGTLPLYPEVDGDGNERWNTQNVSVSGNTFTYDADAGCTTQSSQNNFCAVTGLFSTAAAIDQNIAFHQNNVFGDNVYTGPWQFLCPDQGSPLLSPSQWQAAPYGQDKGTAFH